MTIQRIHNDRDHNNMMCKRKCSLKIKGYVPKYNRCYRVHKAEMLSKNK